MAQFLRPDSNITQTNWTNGFAEIDEATADDTDFSFGANNSSNARLEVGLSDPTGAPGSGTCTVRWRYAKVSSGTLSGTGGTVNQTCGLYEGSTLIASSTVTTGGSWTDGSFTLSSGDVSDWNNVSLRFTQTGSGGGGNARGSAVSWAEVEIPDPSSGQTFDETLSLTSSGSVEFFGSLTLRAISSLSSSAAIALSEELIPGFTATLLGTTGFDFIPTYDIQNGTRITEGSDQRITEDGDRRVLESYLVAGETYDEILTLSGSGSVAFIADAIRNASADFVGSLAQLSASTFTAGAVLVVSGQSTVTAEADRFINLGSALVGSGVISGKAGYLFSITETESASGTISLVPDVIRPAQSSLSSSGSLASIASLIKNADSSFAGAGTGDFTGSLSQPAFSSLAGVSTLTGLAERRVPAAASLVAVTEAEIRPMLILAAANLSGGTGVASGSASLILNASSSLSSNGSLNGNAQMVHSAELKPTTLYRITEDGDVRIVEEGDFRTIEGDDNKAIGLFVPSPTVIEFVEGIYAKKNGVWGTVRPLVYRNGEWVDPRVYVKNNGIWKRVY